MRNFLVRHTSSPTFQLASASIAANALFDAVRKNENPWHLKKLISSGVGVNIVDENGDTPLSLAVSGGFPNDVIETLIDCGADLEAINKNGATPLLISVVSTEKVKANLDTVSLLITKGADVNARKGSKGVTPLMVAVFDEKNPNLDIITALAKAGTDVRIKDRINGKTALDYARENPVLKDNLAVLELLGEKPEPKKTAPKK